MWYHKGVGYGNDVEGQVPGPWSRKALEAYCCFMRRIINTRADEIVPNKSDEESDVKSK